MVSVLVLVNWLLVYYQEADLEYPTNIFAGEVYFTDPYNAKCEAKCTSIVRTTSSLGSSFNGPLRKIMIFMVKDWRSTVLMWNTLNGVVLVMIVTTNN